MGVPKFYRWISERYPCLSEVVKEYQIPEFDNLYLDMNGIIHTCSHPNDDNPHFRITEEKIFADIFHYLEVLFRMIQPKKLFFMAIDGVAPRAKMNQQRSRRFRSAREAELSEKKARDRGEDLPEEDRFDSNCITPGTPFMVRLQEQLKYFVNMKLSTDSLWRDTTVILSGHHTPGEGEHKIMDYIRHQKSMPGYDPNTRHCLYGLDADLLMLGLCTHDPHFSLLREEVKFGGKKSQASKRTPTPEETTFHLLHLSLLREYIDYEFQDLKHLPFYNLENIIDDWVLMGFLMGNDFIPHLPHMHINKGGLPELYNSYKAVLPTIGGYLNEGGSLNLERFEKFMAKLAEYELEKFDDIYSDAKWLEGKTARKHNGRTEVEPTPGPGHVYEMLEGLPEPGVNQNPPARNPDLERLMASTLEFESSDSDSQEADDLVNDEFGSRSAFFQMEFRQHKRDYYIHKLKYSQVTEDTLLEQAECYVRAIQWNLHYYYDGCASWSWFYPHHYAPWITDIKGFSNMRMNFELSKPFLPFEQLMAVLPAASKKLIPDAFLPLMLNENSPIIDFYPTEFEQDLNGKQQDWEAVVLVSFIDEARLLEAMKPLHANLTADEVSRNTHGPMAVCNYSVDVIGRYPSPGFFPDIEVSHCTTTWVNRQEWDVPRHMLKKGLMEGVKLGVFFPGFPTLQYISHTARLAKCQVRVFEQTSRGENTILTLTNQGRPDIMDVAAALVGKEIWVCWPHMVEAKVMSVSNSQIVVRENGVSEQANQSFPAIVKEIKNTHASRHGIEIGDTDILVYACPMSGRRYEMAGGGSGRITLEKQWRKEARPYALQTVVADIQVHDPKFKAYYTVEELFKKDTQAFMLGDPCFAALGTVLDPSPDPKHEGRIRLKFIHHEDPDLSGVYRKQEEFERTYDTSYRAAQSLGISSHMLSRITGCIFLIRGSREQQADSMSKTNIGLNLKFNKKSEEVTGFTRKDENGWTYSKACVEVIKNYQKAFPELFDYLANGNNVNNDMFHEQDVFEGEEDIDERVKELTTFLENLPTHNASRQPFGTESLHEEIVKTVETIISKKTVFKETVMQVRPKLLYLPSNKTGSALVDPATKFKLFDRVVNIREGFSVPLGLRGILMRIQKGSRAEDNLYDVVFDEPFTGGLTLNCSPGRGYRLPGSALLNISFKEYRQWEPNNKNKGRYNKPRAVVQPYQESNGGYGNNNRQDSRNNQRQGSYESRQQNQNRHNYQSYDSRQGQGSQSYDSRQGQDRGNYAKQTSNEDGRNDKTKQKEDMKKKEFNPLLDEGAFAGGSQEPEQVKPCPPDPSALPLPQNFLKGVKIMKNPDRQEKPSQQPKSEPQKENQQNFMESVWQTLETGPPGAQRGHHAGQRGQHGGQRGHHGGYSQEQQYGGYPQEQRGGYEHCIAQGQQGGQFGGYQQQQARGFHQGQQRGQQQFGRGSRSQDGGYSSRGRQDNNRGFYQNQDHQRGGGQDHHRGGGQYGHRSETLQHGSITSVFVAEPKQGERRVSQMENDLKKMLNISAGAGPSSGSSKAEVGNPFVPLQVAKRAAQSKEPSEARSTHSSSREPEGNPLIDSSDQSGGGQPSTRRGARGRGRGGRGRGGRGSKVKMAANFGANFDDQQ